VTAGPLLFLAECVDEADPFHLPPVRLSNAVAMRSEGVALRPQVNRTGDSAIESDGGPTLEHYLVKFAASEARLWILRRKSTALHQAVATRATVHLLRLHAELECLQTVLRLLSSETLSFRKGSDSAERLERYLSDVLGAILKERREGMPQATILSSALSLRDVVGEEEMHLILQQLRSARRTVRSRLSVFMASRKSLTSLVVHMEDKSTRIANSTMVGTNVVGSNTTGSITTSVRQSVIDSGLQHAVSQLQAVVDALSQSIPSDVAASMVVDAKTLALEVAAEKPRPSVIKATADRIKDIAIGVGTVAGPVVLAVQAVMKALGTG